MFKKILIVSDNTREQINGVVTTYTNLEKHAYCDGYSIVYIDPGLYPNCPCPGYPEVRLSWCWQIGREIKKINPDYIHIATEGPLGISAKLFCDDHNISYTTAYHTKFPEFLNQLYHIPKSWTRAYLQWFHERSKMVLTTTESMVKHLQEQKIGKNICSWTRGVDRDVLKPSKEWPHDNIKIKVLYVGRVSKEKNLDMLCQLQDKYSIEIVGDGPYLQQLSLNYPRVKFLGYQKGQKLADSYARADVFAFPSRSDTFGIVMIEAMSLGTPVAAYPVEGPIDVVTHGIDGILDDDLSKAISECAFLIRERVQTHSQRWSWENCWKIFKDNLVSLK